MVDGFIVAIFVLINSLFDGKLIKIKVNNIHFESSATAPHYVIKNKQMSQKLYS